MKCASLVLAAFSLVAFLFLSPPSVQACGTYLHIPNDPAALQQFVDKYRKAGPNGLRSLLAYYDDSQNAKLIPIIDAVAGQRGAITSRLFWYTDLDQASVAASAQHRPILYLRLLGKLTDEYSCANSRFFRTVLYANAEVSKLLREQYILVWVSERPVPVVTIDYGDGRVLKRTLTGNSIHYIVTARGQVIDALPGLYDPKTFASILINAATLASSRDLLPEALVHYVDTNQEALRQSWQDDVRRADPKLLAAVQIQARRDAGHPDAKAAMRLTVSKSKVEQPLLAKITPQAFAIATDRTIDSADEAAWQKIAALHLADATLDASSLALIRSQNPQAYADPGALEKIVARFQQNIAADTVQNNYQFRRQILSWLRESPGNVLVGDLNQRVYAELFLTPRTDPWLGLVSQATYTALNGDGCVVEARK